MRKSLKLHEQIDGLLEPISKAFQDILEDDTANVFLQAGDGMCLCYNNGKNCTLSDIDLLLKMDNLELSDALDKRGI